MKIKYLKKTHDSLIGDVKEVRDGQANLLIRLGIAEIFKEKKAKKVTEDAKEAK